MIFNHYCWFPWEWPGGHMYWVVPLDMSGSSHWCIPSHSFPTFSSLASGFCLKISGKTPKILWFLIIFSIKTTIFFSPVSCPFSERHGSSSPQVLHEQQTRRERWAWRTARGCRAQFQVPANSLHEPGHQNAPRGRREVRGGWVEILGVSYFQKGMFGWLPLFCQISSWD